MSQMVIAGKLVTGPDQFNQLVAEVLQRSPARPVAVNRFVAVRTAAAKLSALAVIWKHEQPIINDPDVFLRQVLVDLCEAFELDEAECVLIIGKQLPLIEGE